MKAKSNIPKIKFSDFLINQKEPKRNARNYKSFWLQHINYCKSGVEVGGVYISPWLYWHINFFKVKVDDYDEYGNAIRPIRNPSLRDNEWYIDWGLSESKRQGKPLMMFGSRRIAKSVIEASRVCYQAFIFQNSGSVVIGADSKDIANLIEYIDDFIANRPDCFSDLFKFGDWRTSASVEIAFSKKETTKKNPITGIKGMVNPLTAELVDISNSDKVVFSRIAIRNLEHGKKVTKDQLLAGITPTEVIADEIGKFSYSSAMSALKPALVASDGTYRALPILAGTGGNVELSVDAERDFTNTDKSGYTTCDVEDYKKIVKPIYFQYTQESDRSVGLFPPGQMCNAGGEKISIPLSEYLNKDFTPEQLEALEGLNIYVTDWENAAENVKKEIEIEEFRGDGDGKKARMFYPSQPEDCFLSTNVNILPLQEGKKTLEYLKAANKYGELVELSTALDGNVVVHESKLDLVLDYPFKGGFHNAPIAIYERPIFKDPRQIKKGTYIAGFDGVKIDESKTTDSVNIMYIFKRQVGISGFQYQIVASYAARTTIDTHYYRQAMLLLKMYNAECLPEADAPFVKYLQTQKAHHLLANARGTNLRINEKSNANTNYGLPATPKNKQHALKKVKDYCWAEHETGEYDENGTPIKVLGIEKIPDPMLLEEMMVFGNRKNYDRIMAFGHVLIWDEELALHDIKGSEYALGVGGISGFSKMLTGKLGRNNKYR